MNTAAKPHHSLSDLVGSVALERGVSKATVKGVVDTFLNTLAASVLNNERIVLRGFGSFRLASHLNKTGGTNQRVAFKAGSDLRKKA